MTQNSKLETARQIEEELFLGLRLLQGVDLKASSEKFGQDLAALYEKPLQELRESGYLIETKGRVALTQKGLLMANTVFEQFLLS